MNYTVLIPSKYLIYKGDNLDVTLFLNTPTLFRNSTR